jgi:hypothetical protein
MKQLILAVFLLLSQAGHADIGTPGGGNFPFKPNQCNSDLGPIIYGGGGDAFPWSAAKPFPWASVEGLWTSIDDNKSNIIFEFKVTRSTAQLKQLLVSVYDANNCKKANMRGVGLINSFEKNVVRVNMNNVLLKLAMFKMQDLQTNNNSSMCGQKALGASFYRLTEDSDKDLEANPKSEKLDFEDAASMLLKKISNPSAYKCKK